MATSTGLCECGCGQPAPIAKWTNSKWGHVRGHPVRFIQGHGSRRPIGQRLAAMTVIASPPDGQEDLGPCHLFTGADNGRGYGTIGREGRRGTAYAHRVAFELANGPIPSGTEIDHLCRNRRCVNPDHLEAVTHSTNLQRAPTALPTLNAAKTGCKHGHPFDAENTYVDRIGKRHCRTCRRNGYLRRRSLVTA